MANDICCTVVIYGPSGSGKSTLARELQKCGFDRIEQMTTRAPRVYQTETPGVIRDETREGEYTFVSEKHFFKAIDMNALAECTDFDKDPDGKVYYGSLLYRYKMPGLHVVTTSIEGAAQLAAIEDLQEHLIFVEEFASRLNLITRGISRKRDTLEEIIRRSLAEKKLYFSYRKYDIFPEQTFRPDILFNGADVCSENFEGIPRWLLEDDALKERLVISFSPVEDAAVVIMAIVNGLEAGLYYMPDIWKD